MSNERLAPFRKALIASASRRLNLGVGLGGVALGLGARVFDVGGNTLPLITMGLGMLAYAALIALDVTNPDYIREVNEPAVTYEPQRLVPPAALRDPELREVYTQILVASDNCQRVYLSTGQSVRSNLEEGFGRARELVAVAARAAQRSDGIYLQLTATNPAEITAETQRLQQLAQQTSDETARDGFTRAAAAKAKELENYGQLQGLRDRVHAQLRLIETSLEGLAAKLVKLDATDYTEAITISESITEHVQTMSNDVEILESTFEDTLREFRA
ncbi:MAG TPA: hypothetical protein VHM70_06585 [Polyangiaceae bacterium]|nr:hypothetical protein [Polyangiaceae bacterium]